MLRTVLLFLCLTSFAVANDKLSCDDLDAIAATLDEVATSFESLGSIEEGGEIDTALGDLIDSLHLVASVENERLLNSAVATMESGWQNMDGDKFAQGLDNVIASLDKLLLRDCE